MCFIWSALDVILIALDNKNWKAKRLLIEQNRAQKAAEQKIEM